MVLHLQALPMFGSLLPRKHHGRINLIVSILLTIFVHTSYSATKTYPRKLTYGIYKQELDPPIFYSTFVPMIYEFNLPIWNNVDVTLRDWRGKCETDEFSPSYSCPVFFHFEKFIERFKKDILPQNSSIVTESVPSPPISLSDDLCNSIEQHFPGSLTALSAMETYIQSLKKCPLGNNGNYFRSINDYLYNIKEIYKTMNQKFEAEFSNRMTSSDRVGPAYYINALSTHQNSLMFNYWVEKTRWNQAQLSCNTQTIPNAIIKPSNFTEHLTVIVSKFTRNLVPSIPIHETSIYYKIPITDCSFVNNGDFVVRILIPVRQRNTQPKMYVVKTAPFIYEEGNEKKICQISVDTGRFLFDEMTGALEKTTCKSRSLCQVKDISESSLPDMCLSSFFSNSLAEVKKHCNYDCMTLNEHGPKIPIFRRISSDTYIVTGNSNIGIVVKCDGKKDMLLEHQDFGALQIQLPCNCYLMFHSEPYHVQKPCSNQLIVNQVMPVHFVKDSLLNNINSVENNISGSDSNIVETRLDPTSEKLRHDENSSSSSSPILWTILIVQSLVIFGLIGVGIHKFKLYRNDIFYSKERLVYNVQSISCPSMAENQRSTSIEST